jgi:hypothetical protein
MLCLEKKFWESFNTLKGEQCSVYIGKIMHRIVRTAATAVVDSQNSSSTAVAAAILKRNVCSQSVLQVSQP